MHLTANYNPCLTNDSWKEQLDEMQLCEKKQSLVIACTDQLMDRPLDKLQRLSSVVVARLPGCVLPSDFSSLYHGDSLINYAVDNLGLSEIILCGHSICSSVLIGDKHHDKMNMPASNSSLVTRVQQREAQNNLSRHLLLEQLEVLKDYSSVKRGIEEGELEIQAAFYLVESGLFTYYDSSLNKYVSVP